MAQPGRPRLSNTEHRMTAYAALRAQARGTPRRQVSGRVAQFLECSERHARRRIARAISEGYLIDTGSAYAAGPQYDRDVGMTRRRKRNVLAARGILQVLDEARIPRGPEHLRLAFVFVDAMEALAQGDQVTITIEPRKPRTTS